MKFRIPGLKELANKLEDDEIIESDSAEGMSGETLYGEDEFESGSPFFHEPSEEPVRNARGISMSSSDGTGQYFEDNGYGVCFTGGYPHESRWAGDDADELLSAD